MKRCFAEAEELSQQMAEFTRRNKETMSMLSESINKYAKIQEDIKAYLKSAQQGPVPESIWALEGRRMPLPPVLEPVRVFIPESAPEPTAQVPEPEHDYGPVQTMGLCHRNIQVWHAVRLEKFLYDSEGPRWLVGPPNNRHMTERAPTEPGAKGPLWAYNVPRWLTIKQAQQNTPDKWVAMRPANWDSY
jgi:hypothetical protein